MEIYCSYHPVNHAGWHCQSCHSHFCHTCMAGKEKAGSHCPVCQEVLRYTGAMSEIPPFWQRLSDFFAYPFSLAPLFLIFICTLLPAFFSDGFIGWIVAVFLLCAETKYVYAVLEKTSSGELAPPGLVTAFSGGGLLLIIQQVFILLAIVGVLVLTSLWLGKGWTVAVTGMLVLALPASTMILATGHKVSQALDPVRLAGVIRALGWPYFVMYGYILLLVLGMGAMRSLVMENLPPVLAVPVTGFVASYFFLIIFYMMGYVLFQYQHLLGSALQPGLAGTPEVKTVLSDKRDLAEIDIALKDGNYDLATTLLLAVLQRKPQDKISLDRLFRLLLETRQWALLDKQSRPVLTMLLGTGRLKDVRKMLRGLYKERPRFEVRDSQLSLHLAQSLYHAGEYRLLLRVLKDFGQRFDKATEEPAVLELSARALVNGLRNGAKARQYLLYLERQYPGHRLAAQVPAQLQALENTDRLAEPTAKFGEDSR